MRLLSARCSDRQPSQHYDERIDDDIVLLGRFQQAAASIGWIAGSKKPGWSIQLGYGCPLRLRATSGLPG
jgi:hypothetical protein